MPRISTRKQRAAIKKKRKKKLARADALCTKLPSARFKKHKIQFESWLAYFESESLERKKHGQEVKPRSLDSLDDLLAKV